MKKLYLAMFLAAFGASSHAGLSGSISAERGGGVSGYIDAITNIPGDMFMYISSAFLKSISDVITSIGTAFGDAADNVQENGNISK
ncbi:hypothetical protein GKC56_02230 [Neisseriaceae bacterium PsAf]|nr:hypothetical protein [Neisseriaceae bacterium PsAf]MCV2503431.1 hypothetical protein [Neisseriaceae bacterium]